MTNWTKIVNANSLTHCRIAAKMSFLLFFPTRFAHARYSSRMIDRFLNWGDHGKPKSGKIKGRCQPPLVIGNTTDHYDLLNPLNTLKMAASLKPKQNARRSIFASVMAVSPRFLYFWKIPSYTLKRDSVKGCFWSGKHLLCKVYCLTFWIRQWPGKRIGATVSL